MLLYSLGVRTATMFSDKVRKMWQGEQEAFDILERKVDPNASYIWFHAASLGEFEQGRPLIERIRKEHPQYKILLTFFSPSGYEVRKDYGGADIVCYLPLDTKDNALRFMDTVKPVMAFFIKYEFWYNYLHLLSQRNVPVYSVSSIFRPDQVFFKWYGREYASVLRCITRFFVQNEESKHLLADIGIKDVEVVDDTRFDRVLEIKQAAKKLPLVEAFTENAQHVFVAGSSWQPDEEIFIPYFNQHSDWKMIIAPHVISEEHLAQITRLLKGRKVARYTQASTETATDADVLIIDCFGLLSSIYRYGQAAYVGGGFGVGIHNTLEAAVWGVPVFFGPNNQKFKEAQGLKACGGGLEIKDASDFQSKMDKVRDDIEKGRDIGKEAATYVTTHAGATEKVLKACLDKAKA